MTVSNHQVVELLLERLAVHNETTVPVYVPEIDLEGANPANHDGYWMPWIKTFQTSLFCATCNNKIDVIVIIIS